MIPKVIHYIWFGGKPYSDKIQKCIDSWNKYLPEYKFMLWNEDTFDVANSCDFVRQAYENKKWAFVSDYVRVWALNKFGGIYLDTDVEVVRPLDQFLVHVQREGGISLSPETVVAAGKSVVRGKNKNGIICQIQLIQFIQNAADPGIHGSDCREIADQVAPLIFCHLICKIDAVRVSGQMGN